MKSKKLAKVIMELEPLGKKKKVWDRRKSGKKRLEEAIKMNNIKEDDWFTENSGREK